MRRNDDALAALAFDLERLQHTGIRTLTPFDEHHPKRWGQRLGVNSPPLLYAAGPVELLDIAGLGESINQP